MAAMDRWVIVRKDGSLLMHEENDGRTFLNRGAEAEEYVISVADLRRRFPNLYEIYAAGPDKAGPYSRVEWEK
jgi:hypothetical protein